MVFVNLPQTRVAWIKKKILIGEFPPLYCFIGMSVIQNDRLIIDVGGTSSLWMQPLSSVL